MKKLRLNWNWSGEVKVFSIAAWRFSIIDNTRLQRAGKDGWEYEDSGNIVSWQWTQVTVDLWSPRESMSFCIPMTVVEEDEQIDRLADDLTERVRYIPGPVSFGQLIFLHVSLRVDKSGKKEEWKWYVLRKRFSLFLFFVTFHVCNSLRCGWNDIALCPVDGGEADIFPRANGICLWNSSDQKEVKWFPTKEEHGKEFICLIFLVSTL